MRPILMFVLCCNWTQHGAAFASKSSASAKARVTAAPIKTLVTGAAGRTGRLVFSKLQEDRRFSPVAVVRTDASGKKLIQETGCGLDQVVVCDVTKVKSTDPPKCVGAKAMVICTSAVPVISVRSLIQNALKIPWNLVRGKKAVDFRSLRFKFKRNQYPEKVDYEGQVRQIDIAKQLGVEHVVVVSSMGGTDPDNFLNKVGKRPDGSGNGDILLWKRKAERYLTESGLRYTIIHPGGLIDTPAGEEELVLDVDDKLMKNEKRSISREDVANLCVAALTVGSDGKSVSFDCITRPVKEGQQVASAEEALSAFMELGVTANYAL
jgi:nucleoside-diphosphate-sugar epimerase